MRLKDWRGKLLGVGIAIVFVLFVGYSIDAFLVDKYTEDYDRNVFITTGVAGILAVLAGGYLVHSEYVGGGFIGGGILTILYGLIRYWSEAGSGLKVVVLATVLGVLIWLGLKKFSK